MKMETNQIVGFVVFAVFIINSCVGLYASHSKLEKMEAYLIRSKYIRDINLRLLGTGYYGRLTRFGNVAGCLLFPQFWIRRGLLDPEDVAYFPKGLRLLAVVPLVTTALCFAALGVLNVMDA